MSTLGRLPQKTQLIVLGFLVLALCVVFYVYMIAPLQSEVSQLQADISRLELEVSSGQALAGQLKELKRAVGEQEARLRELRAVLPEKKETAEIIRRVQELAVESRLKIKSFTPRATVQNDFYEDWPILISLEGNYNALGTFFEKISQFHRTINVENINLKAVEEEATRERTLTATCTATTFVYLEPEAAPAEEAK